MRLTHLSIANFILIERAELALAPGLNVFTGETGAGKSMVVEALKWLLGGRSSTDMLAPRAMRDKAVSPATVEACFEWPSSARLPPLIDNFIIDKLAASTLPIVLVIKRELLPSGKNRAFVNGHLVA